MKNALIYLVVFLALQACVTPAILGLFKLLNIAEQQNAVTLIVGMTVSNLLAIAIFLLVRWTKVSRSYVQSRPWGVLAWCAVAAAGLVLPSMGLQELMPEVPNLLEHELLGMMKTPWGYFAIALLAPVAEEIVYRGAILRALIDKWPLRPGIAIIVSALIFSFSHLNPAQMPHAFIAGLLLGWMCWRTDSIVPGVVLHWVNNTIAFVLCNVMPNPEASLSDIFGGNWLHITLAIVFSLCILLPAIYQLNLRMKPALED